ncbi:NtaA/DmoA family FMN-dependent monooxygenase [Streptococcus thoraltensis]|uniref:NtaA/DmoA family FMN-dependent monooxygenase n=1 Tax=Streptococcus thoraltensis TaxID=55085 RepID=UPI002A838666|nr:NtaA/DmoA family FMN-dependent monooxygenase [Streptococcus thoraltensis]MDY4761204.1 NtaA/DmoA family FMN-dependent monooxygenase [Streptococcus thoraltensis]
MEDYLNNSNKQLKLAMMLVTGYGGETLSWRYSDSDPKAFTNIKTYIELAKLAEKGKIHTLFIADTPASVGAGVSGDVDRKSPMFVMEPMTLLSAVASHTDKIGLVATYSTTYNLPYNLARQLKALDVMSGGRVGWNAVTTGTPEVAYNFGNASLTDTTTRYEMADEMIEAVQSLWGSFGKEAYLADQDSGEFMDSKAIKPVHYQGEYYQTKGPLPIPPSPQGQPPLFQAGPSQEGIEMAGKYASGVYANPFTIEEARDYRSLLKESAIRHGRSADDIKMFSGFMVSVANTYDEAITRRRELLDFMTEDEYKGQIRYLSAMIGIDLTGVDTTKPLLESVSRFAVPNPLDPRSPKAVELIQQGLSPRDVLAHGAIYYHPVVIGTADDVADFMEEWFRAGATDGFSIVPDSQKGVKDFVEKVIPVLQKRGLFHDDYEGETLRDHLGIDLQYGLKNNL